MPPSLTTKALILIPLTVTALIAAFLALGYLIVLLLGLPQSLSFVLPIRILGVLIFLLGLAVLFSVFRLRKPVDVLVSTYVTFTKIRRHIPLEQPAERTEKLTVNGPYRYSRHPLYLGVVLIWIGLWLITDYTIVAFTTLLFFFWFELVITRFEEKELLAMFGNQYYRYRHQVPRIIPFTKLRK